MRKDIRDKEREYFKKSWELRDVNTYNANYEQSEEIRKKQDDAWHRHLFFKGYLEQLEKEKKKNERKKAN